MNLESELKPLFANLGRIDIYDYIGSDEHEHLMLEINLDEEWLEFLENTIDGEEDRKEYTDIEYEDAFKALLNERYGYDDFDQFIVDLIIDFAKWRHEPFDPKDINKSLRDLEVSDSEIRRLRKNLRSIFTLKDQSKQPSRSTTKSSVLKREKVFIVHGHDRESKLELEKFLKNDLNLNPVILSDQITDSIETIIGKLKRVAGDCYYSIVLFTPDDQTSDQKRRARQNVVLEFGYFLGRYGAIGDGKIIVVKNSQVEIPSDIKGVVYFEFSNHIREVFYDTGRHFKEWQSLN